MTRRYAASRSIRSAQISDVLWGTAQQTCFAAVDVLAGLEQSASFARRIRSTDERAARWVAAAALGAGGGEGVAVWQAERQNARDQADAARVRTRRGVLRSCAMGNAGADVGLGVDVPAHRSQHARVNPGGARALDGARSAHVIRVGTDGHAAKCTPIRTLSDPRAALLSRWTVLCPHVALDQPRVARVVAQETAIGIGVRGSGARSSRRRVERTARGGRV